ncbi:MAG: efflux RND transporter periplasmic adaptor subunit [Thermoanaerobaculia bacterium]|nr:efflux RND transporter periplasmic adaptor subunit [Thermoanaerobaculia bacterium]
MGRKRLFVVVGVVLVALVLYAAMRPEPVRVEASKVVRGPLEVTIDEKGETRVRDRFTIAAPASGNLARIEIREGDRVAKGDVLARLVPPPLDARQKGEVKAMVAAADAAARSAEARAAAAGSAWDLARRELERVTKLAAEGIASAEDLDRARSAEDSARRELDGARHSARAAAYELEAARSGLLSLESGGANRAIELVAPADGEVLSIPDRSARVVRAGETLMAVGNSRDIEIVIEVLSADAVRIRPGNTIRIEDWGGDKPLAGSVKVVEPGGFRKISALGIEEQRVRVVGDIRDAPAELGDGYRIEAKIVVWSAESVLKIPVSALARKDGGWSVFRVEGGRVKSVPVKIGQRGRTDAELLEGLADGAVVVVHPGNELLDGARVAAE